MTLASSAETTNDLIIRNATIFDGWGDELIESSIRISGGRIVEIGDVGAAGEVPVIDARGKTVLPGLIDAHIHAYAIGLTGEQGEITPLSYVAIAGSHRLSAALRRGFTTVRDVAGGDPAFARAIDEGLFLSPRYLYTGAALSQTGGHGDRRVSESSECLHGGHGCEVVDGVEAVRLAARDRLRRGAHAIKMMTSGGVVSPADPLTVPQYSAEEIRAVAEEATRRGSYVAAHAYSASAIRHSVLNGCRTIEHGNLMDAEAAELMAEHNAFLVPTLAAYDAMRRRGAQLGLPGVAQEKNREVLEAGQGSIALARAAGVKVGFGSDLMGVLEDEQLNGLRLQAEVDGLLNTLRSATSVNAELIQRSDLGRIAVDCIADFLILHGDLFAKPELLWDESFGRTVIRSGAICHHN